MAIQQVINLIRRNVILLGKPHVIPTLADIVQTVIGSIDENHAGAVCCGVHVEESFGQLGVKGIPQHILVPIIPSIPQRESGVDRNLSARKKIMGDIIVAVFAADGDIQGFLRVDPVVLPTNADTATRRESPTAGGKKFHVSGSVLAFVNILQAITAGNGFVLVGVDSDGITEESFRIGDDGYVGNIGQGFPPEVGARHYGTWCLSALKAPGAENCGGGDGDRAGIERGSAAGIAAVQRVANRPTRTGEDDALVGGIQAARQGDGDGRPSETDIINRRRGVVRPGGGFGILLQE